jgi:acetylornithine deacetylase/succinyl-diaminopimelate desuccinylase-like protein
MDLELLQIARDLIRANTVSSRGTAGAVAVLKPLYEHLGWTIQIQEGPESSGEIRHQNMLARAPGPTSGDGFLLVTHLDTVDVGPRELWNTDPHQLTQKGDQLFGLGSADVKIDAACKLLAMERLARSKVQFTRPLAFLGTYQEELGCKGARHFTREPLFSAKYVLCGEPSELRLIDAHKGYVVGRVRITDRKPQRVDATLSELKVLGKAAHSSTPHLGESAILKAWPQLKGVAEIHAGTVANKVPAELLANVSASKESTVAPRSLSEGEAGGRVLLDDALEIAFKLWQAWQQAARDSSPAPNARFQPPECVVNWGSLHSHGADLEIVFDGRLLPGQKPEALLEPFGTSARALASERFQIDVTVDRSNEAMQLARPSALLEAAQGCAKQLGLNEEPLAKPTNTEAGIFARAGAEAMVFGPGVSTNNAHCANEHTLLSQCIRAIDFYEALARRLCS